MKINFIIFILTIFISLLLLNTFTVNAQKNLSDYDRSWEKQLYEMNYLIMRTSAVNIINGLVFTSKQIKQLKNYEKEIRSLKPPIPDLKGSASSDLVKVRKTYLKLLDYLINKKPVPKKFEYQVTRMRLLESEIIKKSILGTGKARYNKPGCLKCHAPPDHFPKGSVSEVRMKAISFKERKEIDLAHVIGMFGKRGTTRLWQLKSDVDKILTIGQKHVLKNFKCCLVPPGNLSNSTNVGQAFVTDQWIKYFRDIRNVPDEDWKNVKRLYIIPIGDFIEATLPGIKLNDKKNMLKKVEKLIGKVREMDKVDFELQREDVCLKLKDMLKVDHLQDETLQQKEGRQFQSAMFLLYPGNSKIYNKVLKKMD